MLDVAASTSGMGPYQPNVSSCDERPKAVPLSKRVSKDVRRVLRTVYLGVKPVDDPGRRARRREYAIPAIGLKVLALLG